MIQKRLKINTAPASEPFTTSEAKLFLRVDIDDDDDLIDMLIKTARESVESYTKIALINQTWELWLDGFGSVGNANEPWFDGMREMPLSSLNQGASYIEIPKGPLSSVTSITTYNDSDTAATFSSDNYIVSTAGLTGRVILKNGQTWPSDLRAGDAVKIIFVAGYGATGASVPESLQTAMKQLISGWYENRESVQPSAFSELPLGVKHLLNPYRIMTI